MSLPPRPPRPPPPPRRRLASGDIDAGVFQNFWGGNWGPFPVPISDFNRIPALASRSKAYQEYCTEYGNKTKGPGANTNFPIHIRMYEPLLKVRPFKVVYRSADASGNPAGRPQIHLPRCPNACPFAGPTRQWFCQSSTLIIADVETTLRLKLRVSINYPMYWYAPTGSRDLELTFRVRRGVTIVTWCPYWLHWMGCPWSTTNPEETLRFMNLEPREEFPDGSVSVDIRLTFPEDLTLNMMSMSRIRFGSYTGYHPHLAMRVLRENSAPLNYDDWISEMSNRSADFLQVIPDLQIYARLCPWKGANPECAVMSANTDPDHRFH